MECIPKAVQKLVFDGVGLLLPLNLLASPSLLGLAASAAAAPGSNARHLLVKFPTFELPWVYNEQDMQDHKRQDFFLKKKAHEK
jgi:hypothetical protein